MFYNTQHPPPPHKDGGGGHGGGQQMDERMYAAHMRRKEGGRGGEMAGGYDHQQQQQGREQQQHAAQQQQQQQQHAPHQLKHSVDSMKNESNEGGGGDHNDEADGDSHASSMWFPAVTLEIKEDDQPWDSQGRASASTSHHHPGAVPPGYFPPAPTAAQQEAAAMAAAAAAGGGKVLVCNNCYETFRELASLRQHLLANKGVCCFICDKCGKLYETLAALTVHEIVHAAEPPTSYPPTAPSKRSPPTPALDNSSNNSNNLPLYQGGGGGDSGDATDGWPPVIAVPATSEAGRSLIMFAGSTKFEEPAPGTGRASRRSSSSRAVDSGRPFACSVDGCNRSYLCKSHLLGHIKEAHALGYTFACDICSRRFQRNATLKRHKLLVHAKEEEAAGEAAAVEHHRPVGEKRSHPFACDECDKTFPRNATLKRHRMVVHVRADYSPSHIFECDVCNKRFRRNSTLKRHKMFVHSELHDDRPFVCSYDDCRRRYKHKNHLKAHMTKHCAVSECVATHASNMHAVQARVKSCTIGIQVGGSLGGTKSRLNEDNLYACEICEKTFPRNYTLNRHKMLVHSDAVGGRPYVCEYADCGKSYKLKYHLKDHMQKHTKVSMLRY